MARTDRVAEPWGTRTPYGPGETWPVRVDLHLAEGLTELEVDPAPDALGQRQGEGDGGPGNGHRLRTMVSLHTVSRNRLRRPSLIVFDVNETLSDMSPMAERFTDVGAPAHLAKVWFAGLLRDGFSLTAVGVNEAFATIAAEGVRVVLDGVSLDRSIEDAVQHVMEGFARLPLHPDVPDGIRALAHAGYRLVTLSNGSASVAEALLDQTGLAEHFEALLSVEDAPLWKPAAAAYTHALTRCRVDPGDAMLVAVHPWDIDGAARAGLATAWIDRDADHYPGHFKAPDLSVGSLTALAAELPQ